MSLAQNVFFLFLFHQNLETIYANLLFNWPILPAKSRQTYVSALKDIYNRSHIPFCDLTANFCDVNCCSDKDCTLSDVLAFECIDNEVNDNLDPFIMDVNYCYNKLPPDFHSINAILCYEYENSPYLGEFFKEDKIMNTKMDVDSILAQRQPVKQKFNEEFRKEESQLVYKYGSPLLIFQKEAYEYIPFYIAGAIIGKGYCSDSVPIRYLLNQKSNCLLKISKQECENNNKFKINYYLKGSSSILKLYSGKKKQPIKITLKTLCFNNGTNYITFSKNDFKFAYDWRTNQSDTFECLDDSAHTYFNETSEFCENVVLKLNYNFKWSLNSITEVIMTIVIGRVPIDINYFKSIQNVYTNGKEVTLYVSQSSTVEFVPEIVSNISLSGYHIGETVLISNIRVAETNCPKESSKKCNTKKKLPKKFTVTKDKTKDSDSGLEMKKTSPSLLPFKSVGGLHCKEERPVEFGYDIKRTCYITFRNNYSCEEQRDEMVKTFDKLLRFEAVDDGLGGIVPHVREKYADLIPEDDSEFNSTECRLPTEVQFKVLYISVEEKFARYKIIGFKSRLSPGRCTQEDKCPLSWSVLFSEAKAKSPHSRWIEYMSSPIGSSYSWFNMFESELQDSIVRVDQIGSLTFKFILGAIIALFVLRHDY